MATPAVRPSARWRALSALLVTVAGIVFVYSVIFHALMTREGRPPTWITSVYWTLQTMTTLGLGDVTFAGDTGRAFAMVVLLTGVLLLFVLLPFTLIQFVYAPWLEARNAARTPQTMPASLSGHVILTSYGPVEAALIQRLDQFDMPYVVVVADTDRALTLHDQGVRVMVGRIDDAGTFRQAGVERAALVATTLDDMANANVALTVRECTDAVPIVATAAWDGSVDLLRQAGCQDVIQLGDLLGREMARRIAGHGGRMHVVGRLGDIVIAEAATAGTPLVGQTAQQSGLRARFGLNVVGALERGQYRPISATLAMSEDMTLLLSGSEAGLAAYAREYAGAERPPATALVIGGGRVGRATSRNLVAAGVEHRVIEKAIDDAHVADRSRYVAGDASDPAVLAAAGLAGADSVAITTHDDDLNIYLTLYCRRARPDIQILSRATLEQNVSTLRRAGADFVLSYEPMEANAIFDILRHGNLLLLADGLEVFTVEVPERIVGKALIDCRLREETGCNVLAIRSPGGDTAAPDIHAPLKAGHDLVLISDREGELRFFERHVD